MREIKFRVWDNQGRKFKNFPSEYINSKRCVHRCMSAETNDNFGSYVLKSTENTIYQLFTGLKDKNNKEIYEGDILVLDEEYEGREPSSPTIKGKSKPMEVYYSEETSGFKLRYEDKFGKGARSLPYKNFCQFESEIVGNIFENPKLLNNK